MSDQSSKTLVLLFTDNTFSTCSRNQQIIVENYGSVQMIAINRPEKRNAVDPPTAKELFNAFKEFDEDDSMTAAVLYGKGKLIHSTYLIYYLF